MIYPTVMISITMMIVMVNIIYDDVEHLLYDVV